MANNSGTHDPEEQQNDLLAALKAARELGPDMDHAVVASYLEKQKAAAQAKAEAEKSQRQAIVATPGQRTTWPMYMSPALGIMLYVVLLVVSGGHLWWLFWLIPAFGGWGWWGWGHDEGARMQRRMARNEWRRARYAYRYGSRYGPYDDGYGQTPSPQPPQVQPPATQQQTQPIEYD